MQYLLKVKQQGPVVALTEFFRDLLREGVVEALLLPQETSGQTIAPTLVTAPAGIVAANPLAPLAPGNAARLVREVVGGSPGAKIGVVLRPCEVKALVELAKLRQVDFASLLIIGVDCPGTFEPAEYKALLDNNFDFASWLQKTAAGGEPDQNGFRIRKACAMCGAITAEPSSIRIGWLGTNPLQELLIETDNDFLGEKFALQAIQGPNQKRLELLAQLKEKRAAEKETLCAEFSAEINTVDALRNLLSTCLRCYNCRAVCPLCICQECILVSPLFQHDAQKYLEQATRRGFLQLPANTVLFHLTRLVHVGISCVGCGQCESACPVKLPLGTLFSTVGKQVQEIFQYVPGRDLEEKLPLTTYKTAEFGS